MYCNMRKQVDRLYTYLYFYSIIIKTKTKNKLLRKNKLYRNRINITHKNPKIIPALNQQHVTNIFV